jgi:hypothetical protein
MNLEEVDMSYPLSHETSTPFPNKPLLATCTIHQKSYMLMDTRKNSYHSSNQEIWKQQQKEKRRGCITSNLKYLKLITNKK